MSSSARWYYSSLRPILRDGGSPGKAASSRAIARRQDSDEEACSCLASWAIEAPRAYASEAHEIPGSADALARRLRAHKSTRQAPASAAFSRPLGVFAREAFGQVFGDPRADEGAYVAAQEADLLLLADIEMAAEALDALPMIPPRRKGMRRMLENLQAKVQDLAVHLMLRDRILCRFDTTGTGSAG